MEFVKSEEIRVKYILRELSPRRNINCHFDFANTCFQGIAIMSLITYVAKIALNVIANEVKSPVKALGAIMATNQMTLYVNCTSRIGANFKGERRPSMDTIARARKTLYTTPVIIGSSVGAPK
jgi:hypothetical protein